ncbi:hypothetical protein N0V93_010273 [Gnomoniopsis smithogilvyi]|uniref:Uncharacterized protein n=1 Tax=Gnomoniopsis smithogilvyi TaxID=1191159 RepID=A0A9W8YIM7_9PEZI|nr:hypothetical protein N0V93_010273 [Gnomoniopsis smithogilvyi]
MLFKDFIAFSAVPRKIATFQTGADDNPRFPVESKIAWVSAAALNRRYSGGGGSRSASASAGSRKRSRSQMSGANESEDNNHERNVRAKLWLSSYEEKQEEEDDWYEKILAGRRFDESGEELEERGRPRARRPRRIRSEHTVDTLPSLTDTSAAGDLEDMDCNGVLMPSTDSATVPHPKDNAAAGNRDTPFLDNPIT